MTAAVPLDQIQLDADLQIRATGTDSGVVADYVDEMAAGAEFPPVVLYFDGEAYWPGDGFHRIAAARQIGLETIDGDVRQGSRRDAELHAAGANANHGLRRTQADKRAAVTRLLRDPQWSRWSDREIGKACAVDHKTVGRIRRELTGEFPTDRRRIEPSGEFPTSAPHPVENLPPKTDAGAGLVARMLSKLPDSALAAECERRGWSVSK
jgi:hypothetical protein